jgi:hypothetical protein
MSRIPFISKYSPSQTPTNSSLSLHFVCHLHIFHWNFARNLLKNEWIMSLFPSLPWIALSTWFPSFVPHNYQQEVQLIPQYILLVVGFANSGFLFNNRDRQSSSTVAETQRLLQSRHCQYVRAIAIMLFNCGAWKMLKTFSSFWCSKWPRDSVAQTTRRTNWTLETKRNTQSMS